MTAHGFSYHMGPEWVWLMGYFIRAVLLFRKFSSSSEMEEYSCSAQPGRSIMRMLDGHRKHIAASPWMSLPEMTDAHGQENPHGCPAQAWSVATIIDAMYDFTEILFATPD